MFRLNALPENASKKLDVSASFFEIYSGKVHISNALRSVIHISGNDCVCLKIKNIANGYSYAIPNPRIFILRSCSF